MFFYVITNYSSIDDNTIDIIKYPNGECYVMCNVIDDYKEEELSEAWIKIERRILSS